MLAGNRHRSGVVIVNFKHIQPTHLMDRLQMLLLILSEFEQLINFHTTLKSSENHRIFDDFRQNRSYSFTYIRLILEVKSGDDP